MDPLIKRHTSPLQDRADNQLKKRTLCVQLDEVPKCKKLRLLKFPEAGRHYTHHHTTCPRFRSSKSTDTSEVQATRANLVFPILIGHGLGLACYTPTEKPQTFVLERCSRCSAVPFWLSCGPEELAIWTNAAEDRDAQMFSTLSRRGKRGRHPDRYKER